MEDLIRDAVRRLPGVRGHQDADGLNVERLQALAEEQVAALRVWERRLRVARAGVED